MHVHVCVLCVPLCFIVVSKLNDSSSVSLDQSEAPSEESEMIMTESILLGAFPGLDDAKRDFFSEVSLFLVGRGGGGGEGEGVGL